MNVPSARRSRRRSDRNSAIRASRVARPRLIAETPYDPLVPLGPEDPVPIHVEAFLRILGAKKPSSNTVAAYRRDLVGVAMRIAALKGVPVGELRVDALTKNALRAGFSSWADDHAEASMLRARSAWSGFFDYLVAGDLAKGNPIAASTCSTARR